MQNHFSELEVEVRQYLADPERRAKVLEDLAQEILRQMVEMKPYHSSSLQVGTIPSSSARAIRFTGAIVQGVASVIADELSIPTKPKKQPSKT